MDSIAKKAFNWYDGVNAVSFFGKLTGLFGYVSVDMQFFVEVSEDEYTYFFKHSLEGAIF